MQQKGRRSAKEAAAVRRCRSHLPRSALEEKPSRSSDGSVEGLLIDEKLGKQSVGEQRGPQQQPETVSKAIPSAFPAHAIPLRRAPLPPAGSLGVLLNRISDNELNFLDLVSSPLFRVYRGGASVSSGVLLRSHSWPQLPSAPVALLWNLKRAESKI